LKCKTTEAKPDVLQLLRASPGLCLGDRHPDHDGRGAGYPHAAHRAISGRGAPSIKITATYTGASAQTLENSVTQVIEQQLTGLDNLLYFTSTSSSDGQVTITVTFEQGTDPDTAQVQVQNKVQQAESRLPTEVTQSGVTVVKSQSSFCSSWRCMTKPTTLPAPISPTGW
jgi:hypothetical protein